MPSQTNSDQNKTPEHPNVPKKPELIPDEKTGRVWKSSTRGGGYSATSNGKKVRAGKALGGNGHEY